MHFSKKDEVARCDFYSNSRTQASIDETAHYRATNANFHLRDIRAEHVEYGAPNASKVEYRINVLAGWNIFFVDNTLGIIKIYQHCRWLIFYEFTHSFDGIFGDHSPSFP